MKSLCVMVSAVAVWVFTVTAPAASPATDAGARPGVDTSALHEALMRIKAETTPETHVVCGEEACGTSFLSPRTWRNLISVRHGAPDSGCVYVVCFPADGGCQCVTER